MKRLLIISSAPVAFVGKTPFLDIKFVEGMRVYDELWDGSIECLLKKTDDAFPFGQAYERDQLPFAVNLIPDGGKIGAEDIAGFDAILCGGDNYEYLHLADMCRAANIPLIFTIENPTETRRQIIFLDRSRSLPRKIYSFLWMLNQERRRRRAFRMADGIQANGYPAFSAYRSSNSNIMMYLDNRVGEDLQVTDAEMEARHQRLLSGAPLRLIHSGRLEPLKGSQDLIPVARRLVAKGVDFELDIFGGGSLEDEIREDIIKYGLNDRVRLNGVVDFETELVPFSRAHGDIYLSCHRQSDPSCTYIESMGCGLAVIGYANRMWSALCQDSNAGWTGSLGNATELADIIVRAADDRPRLAACCLAAQKFAGAHSFENEFRNRMDHVSRTASVDHSP